MVRGSRRAGVGGTENTGNAAERIMVKMAKTTLEVIIMFFILFSPISFRVLIVVKKKIIKFIEP